MLKEIVNRKKEDHEKLFEKWFDSGEELLWIDDVLFLAVMYHKFQRHVQFWACDNEENCFRLPFVEIDTVGEMIKKGKTTKNIKKAMISVSKELFINYLFAYDSIERDAPIVHYLKQKVVFSFDSIDFNKLPSWLVAELVEHKLSK